MAAVPVVAAAGTLTVLAVTVKAMELAGAVAVITVVEGVAAMGKQETLGVLSDDELGAVVPASVEQVVDLLPVVDVAVGAG